MMNLIQKFFNRDVDNRQQVRANFSQYFFSVPEHKWISTGVIREHFEKLFRRLPVGVLEAMMRDYPLIFIRSKDLPANRNPGQMLSNTVVVFPEFEKLLHSDKRCAEAYLAHEIAFVLYEMEEAKRDPLMAEVSADKFVCDIGLINELEELLLMLDETIEKRLRLTYLTINHFAGSDN